MSLDEGSCTWSKYNHPVSWLLLAASVASSYQVVGSLDSSPNSRIIHVSSNTRQHPTNAVSALYLSTNGKQPRCARVLLWPIRSLVVESEGKESSKLSESVTEGIADLCRTYAVLKMSIVLPTIVIEMSGKRKSRPSVFSLHIRGSFSLG